MGCGTSSDEVWYNYRVNDIDRQIEELQRVKAKVLAQMKEKKIEIGGSPMITIPKSVTKAVKDVNEISKDITIITLLSDRNNCHAPISHSSDSGGSDDSDDSD